MTHVPRAVYQKTATHTRAVVSFHGDEGFDGVINGAHPQIGRIVGIQTNKAFGDASGTFSVTIKKPQEFLGARSLHRLFPDPEDTWSKIKFVVDGQVIDTMLGLVDSVNEDTGRYGEGARVETYTITGRDFGKVFEQTELFVNLHDPSVFRNYLAYKTWMEQQGAFLGTPDKIIRALIEVWIGNRGITEKPWELPRSLGASSLFEFLELATIQTMTSGNGNTFAPQLLSPDQRGRLWDVMQEYSNGVMNEMWIDLVPNRGSPRDVSNLVPGVYLRERMFPTRGSRANWDRLPTFTLMPQDVEHRAVAKGGAANRYNYWTMGVPGFQGNQFSTAKLLQEAYGSAFGKPGSIPIINAESIRRHGLRMWEGASNYLLINSPDEGKFWLGVAANWLARVHDWYSVAPLQLSGSLITTRLFPEIRIGTRIREVRQEGTIVYYCEGVAHDWQYPGRGRTTLTVTHGEYEDINLLDRIYAQYDNPAIITQEECTDMLPPPRPDQLDESISNEDLAKIAAGCRFGASISPIVGDELQFGLPDVTFVTGGDAAQALALAQAQLAVVGVGAPPPPDPRMLPTGTPETQQADLLAIGLTSEALPPPQPLQEVPLSREALEAGQPISLPDPLGGFDPESLSEDPLAGLTEEIGLP